MSTAVRQSAAPDWALLAGLRFFLASVVMFGHLAVYRRAPIAWSQPLADFGGKAAVVGFLVVSGFSIAASIAQKPVGFYRRRLVRIYPLYFFAVLFGVALEVWFGGFVQLPRIAVQGEGWLSAVGNFLLVQTFLVKPVAFNGPVWSLAVEVFFYLLAPLLARLRPYQLLLAMSFSVACFLLPRHDEFGPVYIVLSRLNALRYFWCWVLGFILYRERAPHIWFIAVLLTPLMWVHHVASPYAWATYALCLASIALAFRVQLPARTSAVLQYLGDLSYPLYLFHYAAFLAAFAIFGVAEPMWLTTFAVALSALCLWGIDGHLKPRVFAPLLMRAALAVEGWVGRRVGRPGRVS